MNTPLFCFCQVCQRLSLLHEHKTTFEAISIKIWGWDQTSYQGHLVAWLFNSLDKCPYSNAIHLPVSCFFSPLTSNGVGNISLRPVEFMGICLPGDPDWLVFQLSRITGMMSKADLLKCLNFEISMGDSKGWLNTTLFIIQQNTTLMFVSPFYRQGHEHSWMLSHLLKGTKIRSQVCQLPKHSLSTTIHCFPEEHSSVHLSTSVSMLATSMHPCKPGTLILSNRYSVTGGKAAVTRAALI